jgi:hypothetical protein
MNPWTRGEISQVLALLILPITFELTILFRVVLPFMELKPMTSFKLSMGCMISLARLLAFVSTFATSTSAVGMKLAIKMHSRSFQKLS